MNPEQTKTVIAEDVEITGNIKCESNIQLNGKLNGDLQCGGQAMIGNTASVKGNMSIETVSIMGQVNGNITAKDKIELKSTARLHGDIRAKRLTVEDGVTFVGKVEVSPAGPTAQAKTTDEKAATAAAAAEASEAQAAEGQQKGIFRR